MCGSYTLCTLVCRRTKRMCVCCVWVVCMLCVSRSQPSALSLYLSLNSNFSLILQINLTKFYRLSGIRRDVRSFRAIRRRPTLFIMLFRQIVDIVASDNVALAIWSGTAPSGDQHERLYDLYVPRSHNHLLFLWFALKYMQSSMGLHARQHSDFYVHITDRPITLIDWRHWVLGRNVPHQCLCYERRFR